MSANRIDARSITSHSYLVWQACRSLDRKPRDLALTENGEKEVEKRDVCVRERETE